MIKTRLATIGLILISFIFSACGTNTAQTTPAATVEPPAPVISASGKLLPAHWAALSFQAGGAVVEIPVEIGQDVKAGDVLLRIDDTDARLAVQQAEAALASAQAQLAQMQAGPRPEEIAVAQAQVDAAGAGISEAQSRQDQAKSGATEAEVAAAQARLAAAKAAEWGARDLYNREGWMIGEGATQQLRAAEAELAAAQAQVDSAQRGGAAQLKGAQAGVWAASAQRKVAQAQLDLLKAGASPEAIAVADAAVKQAEAALAVARTALDRTVIHAPFDGTVGAIQTRVGEIIVPSQSVIIIGDLSTLRVETTDLSELDIARIHEGQTVDVTFDALPAVHIPGRVTRIAPMSTPGQSSVNYQVIVELEKADPALRWGMTAFVDVQVQP